MSDPITIHHNDARSFSGQSVGDGHTDDARTNHEMVD